MTRFMLHLIVLVVACAIVSGCGGDGAKGVNKDKDKPRPADKESTKS